MKAIKLVILIVCLSISYTQAQNYFIYAENGKPIAFNANQDIQYIGLVDNASATDIKTLTAALMSFAVSYESILNGNVLKFTLKNNVLEDF